MKGGGVMRGVGSYSHAIGKTKAQPMLHHGNRPGPHSRSASVGAFARNRGNKAAQAAAPPKTRKP